MDKELLYGSNPCEKPTPLQGLERTSCSITHQKQSGLSSSETVQRHESHSGFGKTPKLILFLQNPKAFYSSYTSTAISYAIINYSIIMISFIHVVEYSQHRFFPLKCNSQLLINCYYRNDNAYIRIRPNTDFCSSRPSFSSILCMLTCFSVHHGCKQ